MVTITVEDSRASLMPLFGSDAVVWTTDMADLTRDDAVELLVWMAQVLVAATLAGWLLATTARFVAALVTNLGRTSGSEDGRTRTATMSEPSQ